MKITPIGIYQINKANTNTKTYANFKGVNSEMYKAEKIRNEYKIITGAKINKNTHEILKILAKNAYNPEQKIGELQRKITELAPLLCDDTIIAAHSGRFSDSIIVSHPVFKYTIVKDYSTQTYGSAPDIINSDVYTVARHINEQIAYGKQKGWTNSSHYRYVEKETPKSNINKQKSPEETLLKKIEERIILGTGVAVVVSGISALIDGCEANKQKIKDKKETTTELVTNPIDSTLLQQDNIDYSEKFNLITRDNKNE